MARRRSLQLVLAVAVTGLCLWLLAADLDRGRWLELLGDVEPAPLLLGLVVAATTPLWRGARLAALLPPARRPGRGVLSRLSAEVLMWNFLLPFKLGELSFPWLLHRRVGLPIREAAALFVLVRLCDLVAVAGLLALGAASLPPVRTSAFGWLALPLGVALLASPPLLIAAASRWRRGLVDGGRFARLVEGAGHASGAGARLAVLATTLGLWASHVAIAALALHATDTSPGLGATIAASAAGNLAFALPVSGVLGLGPQQVAFAGALQLAGVDWTTAVVAAVSVHLVVTGAAVGGGFACWLMADRSAKPRPSPAHASGTR